MVHKFCGFPKFAKKTRKLSSSKIKGYTVLIFTDTHYNQNIQFRDFGGPAKNDSEIKPDLRYNYVLTYQYVTRRHSGQSIETTSNTYKNNNQLNDSHTSHMHSMELPISLAATVEPTTFVVLGAMKDIRDST